MVEIDTFGIQPAPDVTSYPVAAMRALALAHAKGVSFVEISPSGPIAWGDGFTPYPGVTSRPIDYPFPVDFEEAERIGLLERYSPRSYETRPPANSTCYRYDLLSERGDFALLHACLDHVSARDCEEAQHIPSAIPVALIGRMEGMSEIRSSPYLRSLVGNSKRHYVHGYIVGESRKLMLLRGAVTSNGEPITQSVLVREEMQHHATLADGAVVIRDWPTLQVGMTREAFLEIAQEETAKMQAIVSAEAEFEKARSEAFDKFFGVARAGLADLAEKVVNVREREALPPIELADSTSRSIRIAERLIGTLKRPSEEVVREAMEMDGEGAPKKDIIVLLNEVGLPCTYANYRARLTDLREALDMASPGWDSARHVP